LAPWRWHAAPIPSVPSCRCLRAFAFVSRFCIGKYVLARHGVTVCREPPGRRGPRARTRGSRTQRPDRRSCSTQRDLRRTVHTWPTYTSHDIQRKGPLLRPPLARKCGLKLATKRLSPASNSLVCARPVARPISASGVRWNADMQSQVPYLEGAGRLDLARGGMRDGLHAPTRSTGVSTEYPGSPRGRLGADKQHSSLNL
jgi:hypothetical protein